MSIIILIISNLYVRIYFPSYVCTSPGVYIDEMKYNCSCLIGMVFPYNGSIIVMTRYSLLSGSMQVWWGSAAWMRQEEDLLENTTKTITNSIHVTLTIL